MLVLMTNVQRINTSIQNALKDGYEHTEEELKKFEEFKSTVEVKRQEFFQNITVLNKEILKEFYQFTYDAISNYTAIQRF